ncbi:uncharacterized protein J3D65DRAFT_105723 [Phyllosticta citribraziliensis]|uniref:Uncharacterized protein n=1 Tax=Phyllosticta citribraziliensis TaxID=989973 RepID=A0ABR1LFG6_9PEZI
MRARARAFLLPAAVCLRLADSLRMADDGCISFFVKLPANHLSVYLVSFLPASCSSLGMILLLCPFASCSWSMIRLLLVCSCLVCLGIFVSLTIATGSITAVVAAASLTRPLFATDAAARRDNENERKRRRRQTSLVLSSPTHHPRPPVQRPSATIVSTHGA